MSDFLQSLIRASKELTSSLSIIVAFVGLVLLFTAFLTREQYPLLAGVALGLGLTLLLVLAIVQADIYIQVRPLYTLAEVSRTIRAGFQSVDGGEIAQTFVGANLIAGASDYAGIMPHQPASETSVSRYFFISSPFDINFAEHSVEFTEVAAQKGIEIKNYYWSDPGSNLVAEMSWNVTALPDEVIITMSSRDDQRHGAPQIVKSSDSKDVVGVLIKSKRIADFIRKEHFTRFHKAKQTSLTEAKLQVFEMDRELYLSAAVHSLIKEWIARPSFAGTEQSGSAKISCAAIVGSFARRLRKRQVIAELGEIYTSDSAMRDVDEIDVLVFVKDLTRQDVDEMKKIAKTVLKRFELLEHLRFVIETDLSPIGLHGSRNMSNGLVVNLIINDEALSTAQRPSTLVASHRIEDALMVRGSHADLNDAYQEPSAPSAQTLLSEPLGVVDLLKQLTIKTVTVRYWDSHGKMQERFDQMSKVDVQRFAQYTIKWISVNLLRVLDRPADPDQWRTHWAVHCGILNIDEGEVTREAAIRFGDKVKELLADAENREARLVRYRSFLDKASGASS